MPRRIAEGWECAASYNDIDVMTLDIRRRIRLNPVEMTLQHASMC